MMRLVWHFGCGSGACARPLGKSLCAAHSKSDTDQPACVAAAAAASDELFKRRPAPALSAPTDPPCKRRNASMHSHLCTRAARQLEQSSLFRLFIFVPCTLLRASRLCGRCLPPCPVPSCDRTERSLTADAAATYREVRSHASGGVNSYFP